MNANMKRLLLHFPVGVVNVALVVINSWVGVTFAAGFLAYELSEKRQPYKDINGWLWGVAAAAIGLWLVDFSNTNAFVFLTKGLWWR